MSSNLNPVLNPNSIAIIGASNSTSKRGYIAMRSLLDERFAGKIYPINPRESEILGRPCYPSIDSAPPDIDLALICTPASTLPDLIRACGQSGIKGVVVLASGFSETGDDGLHLERRATEAAREHGVRIVGPNTSGIFNTHKACNLVGFKGLRSGNLGLLAQSGNMALSLVTEAQRSPELGFSTYIGVGNEADIQFDEYLEYFADDPNTDAIIAYVEGLKQGRDFLSAAKRTVMSKPLVLYKSGRTGIGQQSARSHTGALAGSYQLARGVMRQHGITLVERSDQILAVAHALSLLAKLPPMQGRNVAILADGGGHATITADALVESGFSLPELSTDTRERLAALLPPAASVRNPVDVAGGTDSNPELFTACMELIMQDENVDAVIMVGLFGGYQIRFAKELTDAENNTGAALAELAAKSQKPLVMHSIYAAHQTEAIQHLKKTGIPLHPSIETSVTCLTAFADYSEAKNRFIGEKAKSQVTASARARAIVQQARSGNRSSLYEHEGLELLREFGVNTAAAELVTERDELAAAHARLNGVPVAMKIVSEHILHKSDAGGVALKLGDQQALESAWDQIFSNAQDYAPGVQHLGVLLAPMAQPGVEIILGVTRDPQYGHVMMFGLGGIFVEVLKDVVFRALPLSQADVADMLDEIAGKRILDGARGQAPVDRESLIDLMIRLSNLCTAHPQIEEMDLNPVIVNQDGCNIVDVRILLQKDLGSTS